MKIGGINNTSNNQQSIKNINFEANPNRINPYRISNPNSIVRRNKFGLVYEAIDYRKGTNKIINHIREYLGKNGNSGHTSEATFFPDGSKSLQGRLFDSKYRSGAVPIETKERVYTTNKKLMLKERTYVGSDENGLYKAKIATTYHLDGKTPSTSVHTKNYVKITGSPEFVEKMKKLTPSTITTKFSETGKMIEQTKSGPSNWETNLFDEETGKVIAQSKSTPDAEKFDGFFSLFSKKKK